MSVKHRSGHHIFCMRRFGNVFPSMGMEALYFTAMFCKEMKKKMKKLLPFNDRVS